MWDGVEACTTVKDSKGLIQLHVDLIRLGTLTVEKLSDFSGFCLDCIDRQSMIYKTTNIILET